MVKHNGPLITIRVTLEERRQLNAQAAAKRLSLNQYCRYCLGLPLEDKSPSVQRLERRPTTYRRGSSAAASAD